MVQSTPSSAMQLRRTSVTTRTSGAILQFIDTTGPGGAETIYLQMAAGMRERGWNGRSVVVGPGWVLDSLRSLELPFDVAETHGRLDFRYMLRLNSIVRRHRVQLIHAHLFSPAVYAAVISAFRGTPVIATFHGASDILPGGRSTQWRRRLIDRHATVVCVSDALAVSLAATLPSGRRDLRVIPNGVDVHRFSAAKRQAVRREHAIGDDVFLIGALGNMRAAKDYPTLLRAAAALAANRPVAFAIVGEQSEPLHGELAQLRTELGLQDRVSFWGFRNDAPQVLAAFDALAISSSSEGFSLAAVQAMAAGKPVVATRCGGPEEIITDGIDGLLVETSSPIALAEALRRLVESPALCAKLGAAAHRTAVEGFSMERMLDSYEELYLERIGGA